MAKALETVECPVIACLLDFLGSSWSGGFCRCRGSAERFVVRGSQINPSRDVLDIRIGKLRLLRRHVGFFGVSNQFVELARLATPLDHTAVDEWFAVREIKICLLGLPAVTLQALRNQNRPHPLLEKGQPLSHLRRMIRRHGRGFLLRLREGERGINQANHKSNDTRSEAVLRQDGFHWRDFLIIMFGNNARAVDCHIRANESAAQHREIAGGFPVWSRQLPPYREKAFFMAGYPWRTL